MKKQELLNIMNDELLDKLFGFCYARTSSSYEAQELCSDIVFELVKAANTDGEVKNPYAFLWQIAKNTYADFSTKRRQRTELFYQGDAEQILPLLAATSHKDDNGTLLREVYRRIAFLTKAYREVMILFYLDGRSTAEIAKLQQTSEVAIRQRLFSAREKIRSEVKNMEKTAKKPVALDKLEYSLIGTGNPYAGDPRIVCTRQFSKHVVWLCRKKPRTAAEIAAELNVPTLYVEEELELLTWGENGTYGLLRKTENGKYIINFILFDKEQIEQAHAIYMEQLPNIANIICDYIEKHREEYLAFPYLNHKVDFNLILWQQVFQMTEIFSWNVNRILSEDYFADIKKSDRPFSLYGHVYTGQRYGCGCDDTQGKNICGYSFIEIRNIYISRIRAHFHCGHNIATDMQLQLAIRAINGISIDTLSEAEKEHAAKAVECGYLYREGEMLYTKILVSDWEDYDNLFSITNQLSEQYFEAEVQKTAEKIAALIRKAVPEHLLGDWELANALSNTPIHDALVEILIQKGILIPPKDGIGAEGCWMIVTK